MKIKYIHFSEPNKVKIYDTEVALKKNPFLDPFIRMTQEEFDKMELEHMERDKQKRHILSYEIVNSEEE